MLEQRAARVSCYLLEDGLHVCLGDQECVEVPDENPGTERTRVRLVGHIAGHHATGGERPAGVFMRGKLREERKERGRGREWRS